MVAFDDQINARAMDQVGNQDIFQHVQIVFARVETHHDQFGEMTTQAGQQSFPFFSKWGTKRDRSNSPACSAILSKCSTKAVTVRSTACLPSSTTKDHPDAQQLVFGGILEPVPFFGKVSSVGRIIHLDVKSGSVPRILQLGWNGDTFLFNLFPDGLGRVINSAGVDSRDFGFAASLVSLETMGFGKQGITSPTSKASTVFGQVLDVTEVTTVQVESEGALALSFG